MFLSVITPTFNRAHTLRTCYESLLAQTDKDFEWIVVDDGSSDSTRALLQCFIEEEKIKITYHYQSNGGKPRAHNKAVELAQGEMCICVDSDDALSPDAVETAKVIWHNRPKGHYIGILAKRGDFGEHKPICSNLPEGVQSCTMLDLQQKYYFEGDTALFFDTAILKAHPFKCFEGERFVPEDSLYVELDESGEMLLENKVLYYCEYLEDGLTAHYHQLLRNNPIGTSYSYYIRSRHSKSFKDKLHNMIISKAYLKYSGAKQPYEMKGGLAALLASMAAPLYIKLKIH